MMPKRSRAELQAQYDERLALFAVLWEWLKPQFGLTVSIESDPLEKAKSARDSHKISQELSGLNQAINDSLEMAKHAPPDLKNELDLQLATNDLPSLTTLCSLQYKKVTNIVRRGSIRTEEEYYLCVEKAGQLDFPLNEKDQKKLDTIIHEFELHRSNFDPD